jgi:hypothetical protein
VRWVLREREKSEGGAGGSLKLWQLGGAGQKQGREKRARRRVLVEGEGGSEREPRRGGQQCGAAGSGPRPLGAGDAVAMRIGEGGGRG